MVDIVVLGGGRLLEFDSPAALLSKPNSHFFLMVEQSGVAEAEYLRNVVRNRESTRTERPDDSIVGEEMHEPSETDPFLSGHYGKISE